MGVLGKKLRGLQGGRVAFICPGCDEMHQITVEGDRRPLWGWNRDADRPTFTPSILVRGVRLDMDDDELDRIMAEYNLPADRERVLADKRINTVCHSFVTDGFIRYLDDCTHDLKGQVVPLPDIAEGD